MRLTRAPRSISCRQTPIYAGSTLASADGWTRTPQNPVAGWPGKQSLQWNGTTVLRFGCGGCCWVRQFVATADAWKRRESDPKILPDYLEVPMVLNDDLVGGEDGDWALKADVAWQDQNIRCKGPCPATPREWWLLAADRLGPVGLQLTTCSLPPHPRIASGPECCPSRT